ncbi:hypothetical protein ACFPFX_04370 [Streptomyces mauvecolor]|uniref:Serine/threonine protein kinase n=1 Tax=Streptomyces mauvecolor TaxID=58345 RepID=A0ABV9UES5_9ACTN
MTTQFRPEGPSTEGYWNDRQVAEGKFLGEVGLYGSGETVIRLAEESADGRYEVVKSWSQRTGMVTGDVA